MDRHKIKKKQTSWWSEDLKAEIKQKKHMQKLYLKLKEKKSNKC